MIRRHGNGIRAGRKALFREEKNRDFNQKYGWKQRHTDEEKDDRQ